MAKGSDMIKRIFTYLILGITAIAISISGVFFCLNILAKNHTFSGKIIEAKALDSATTLDSATLDSAKILDSATTLDSTKALDSANYRAKLVFECYDTFGRSTRISSINITEISWDKRLDSIIITANEGRNLYFRTTSNISDIENLGFFRYQINFYPIFKHIAYYYVLLLVSLLIAFFLCVSFAKTINALPPNITPKPNAKPLQRNDYIFLAFSFLLVFGIYIFTLWLGFPGFHIIGDTYASIALGKNNHHPVFISYILELLYLLFGKHLYYLFLFNITPFYLGIFLLIAGFYLRFRSKLAILLICPTFIGNIYFQNFIQYNSFSLPMLLFLLYSLILFLILAQGTIWQSRTLAPRVKILWIFVFVIMAFALLWRHNAIFSVFPAFFVIIYMFLQNRKCDFRIYAKLVILSGMASLAFVIFIPKILTKSKALPANHIFLHQIAGACVINDDSSCFKDEWYYPYKNFDDVKKLYNQYRLNADPMNVTWAYDDLRPFKHEKLAYLKTQWIKAIAKYPSDFLSHEMRFIKAMWLQNPQWIYDAKRIQAKQTNSWHISVVSEFPKNEQSIIFSKTKEQIYHFLYSHKILFNHIVGVVACFVVMIFCGIAMIIKQFKDYKAILVFGFSAGFAGFFSAIFIAIFSPVPETRYMSPILPLAIVAIAGFVAFVCEIFKTKIFYSKDSINRRF